MATSKVFRIDSKQIHNILVVASSVVEAVRKYIETYPYTSEEDIKSVSLVQSAIV